MRREIYPKSKRQALEASKYVELEHADLACDGCGEELRARSLEFEPADGRPFQMIGRTVLPLEYEPYKKGQPLRVVRALCFACGEAR